jgi:phosphoribosylformylglycinamidine cyclo-ligase
VPEPTPGRTPEPTSEPTSEPSSDPGSDPDLRPTRAPLSYGDAGVDLEAADRSVELIGARVAATHGPEVLGGIGGFGGLFRFDTRAWRDPVLVSSTDGVGTKVELARQLGRLDGLGHDLVGMVVDDLVAVGARPLFMNDYLAVGRLDPERVATLVGSIADACGLAGCALVGGETAEHPGVLAEDAFDVAGFAVGVVERDELLGRDRVREGDVLVALPSSGPHSNGYSLIRRIVEGVDLHADHGLPRSLADLLLEPTRVHTPDVLAVLDALGVGPAGLHAACHVTGGGLPGNLPRVLPPGLDAIVASDSWEWPAVFNWLAEHGPVAAAEMWRTFNCGVGMVLVVAPAAAGRAVEVLAARGVDAWVMGSVRSSGSEDSDPAVRFS